MLKGAQASTNAPTQMTDLMSFVNDRLKAANAPHPSPLPASGEARAG
jgi:hypothetical protein